MTLLETRTVTRFALRRSLIHKLEEKNEKETKEIRLQMESGVGCPTDGPFELELNSSEQAEIGWKEIFEQFLTKRFTPRYRKKVAKLKAVAYMGKLHAKVPKKPVVKILVKTNPKWKVERAA